MALARCNNYLSFNSFHDIFGNHFKNLNCRPNYYEKTASGVSGQTGRGLFKELDGTHEELERRDLIIRDLERQVEFYRQFLRNTNAYLSENPKWEISCYGNPT